MEDHRDELMDMFKFHGHKCWASTVGFRAGAAALRELGVKRTGSSGELHCIVEIGNNHGAQYSTGCTFGKNNIEKAGWGKLALTLIDKKKEQSVRVSYKPTRHKEIGESAFMRKRALGVPPTEIPKEEAWEMVNIVWEAPEDEIITIEEIKPYPWEEYGEIMGLKPCDSCGELVAVAYLRLVGEKHMCTPCSGYE